MNGRTPVVQLDGYMRANLKARHLQLLVALDDFRNVSRAATQANITQPAVSKALGELENINPKEGDKSANSDRSFFERMKKAFS